MQIHTHAYLNMKRMSHMMLNHRHFDGVFLFRFGLVWSGLSWFSLVWSGLD